MAFQTPAFAFYHAVAQDGIVLTPSPAFTAAAPARHLSDYRLGAFAKFSAGANPTLKIDRLVVPPTDNEKVNRLTMPPMSNGGNITVEVDESATGAFAGEEAPLGSATWTDGEWFDSPLSGPSTLRYIQLTFTSGNATEVGEVFLSRLHSLGEWGDPDWDETPRVTAISVELGAGWAGTFDQPRRKAWRFRHQAASTTDQAIYNELFTQTHNGVIPFLFIPPNDADASAWVQIQPGSIRKSQASSVPGVTGLLYTYEMTLVESTL